jgi:hypothetical protein
MSVDLFHSRDFQRDGQISISYVDTNLNPADFCTKKLSATKIKQFIDILCGSASSIPGSETAIAPGLLKLMFKKHEHAPQLRL